MRYNDRDAKVKATIYGCAATCTVIAVQPIPIADTFILTPIQAVMVLRIGTLYGYEISTSRAADILKQIFAVIGAGWLAQQLVLASLKMIPIFGSLTGPVLVFSITTGIGYAAKEYFALGMKVDEKKIKSAFEVGKKVGKNEYQEKPHCFKKAMLIPMEKCDTCIYREACLEK